ncbi:MAG: hypothetical protein GY839_09590 [candidate division Zixibacteria bacterium]|nr:hypothetical protein [candidate division Zixibacteria bacterium]
MRRIFISLLTTVVVIGLFSTISISDAQELAIPSQKTDVEQSSPVKESKYIQKNKINIVPPAPDSTVILQGGDDIASAMFIPALPYFDSGTTAGYTDDYDEACPYTGSTSPDVVYLYIPDNEGFIDISLCTSSYDTKLYVYEYDTENLLECDDDGCGNQSHISGLLVYPGQELYIVVDGYGGDFGNYEIYVDGFFVYEYLPGDVNMIASNWPPIVAGSDITYLVNYYRGIAEPCMIADGSFWASADANGDCMIIASDVTKLVTYIRGLTSISYCADFEPVWLTPEDLPPSAPPSWPHCDGSFSDSLTHDVFFWFGNVDGSPVYLTTEDSLVIDVFVQTDDSAFIGDMFLPIGIEDQYVDSFLTDMHEIYYPLTEWGLIYFSTHYGSPPNPAGWSSQSFTAIAQSGGPISPWLHEETPHQIMKLFATPASDTSNIGDPIYCIGEGETPFDLPLRAGDTLGWYDYPITSSFSPVIFDLEDTSEVTFEYLPGDVSMATGAWPPMVLGTDVTFFVNVFTNDWWEMRCHLSNPSAPSPPGTTFWAAADVNGDCMITGNDVTQLVRFFRGQASINYCPEYPPAWSTPGDLPPSAPDGWPNCEDISDDYSDPFESSPDPEITFWYGNLDSSPLTVEIGKRANIDVYVQTSPTVMGGYVHVPLGVEDQYFDSLLSQTEGQFRYPFNEWFRAFFSQPFGSPPNPAGWSSQSFMGWADDLYGDPWLNATTPINILTFVVRASESPEFLGDTVQCIGVGGHPTNVSLYVGAALGAGDYPVAASVSPVHFICPPENGAIGGMVTDGGSNPLIDVHVSATGSSSGDDYSDLTGYMIDCLEPGSFDVLFSLAGYHDTTVYNVTVNPGTITPLSVILTAIEPPGGWIYHQPSSFTDTVNAGSVKWTGAWLINYDDSYQVTINSMEISDTSWIIVDDLSGTVISTQDSVFMPITFDLEGFSDEIVTGQIIINHDGVEEIEILECQINVTSTPAVGPVIRTFPPGGGSILSYMNFELEPDVNGLINIRVFNDGDLPLILDDVIITNLACIDSIIPPSVAGDTVTTLGYYDLFFELNTTDLATQQCNGEIKILSNESDVIRSVSINVADTNMAGPNGYGDVNFDGWCNEADITYLIKQLAENDSAYCIPGADADNSGEVDLLDVEFLEDYLREDDEAPINECGSTDRYRNHLPDNQVQMSFESGSRDDCISIPVMVQNQSYFKSQISFKCASGLFDSAQVENVVGLGLKPYLKVYPGGSPDSVIVVISDSSQTGSRISFESLTTIYNLKLYITSDAPIGIHRLVPSAPDDIRGPTVFIQNDTESTLRGPMFPGTLLSINPEVTLDNITGIPSVNYTTVQNSFYPTLTITSDASVTAELIVNIIDPTIEDEDSSVVYSDTSEQVLDIGTHPYSLAEWTTSPPGAYKTIAAIIIAQNESDKCGAVKGIHFTNSIHTGIPVGQGFEGGPSLRGGRSRTRPQLLFDNWNEGWRNISADGRVPPEWETIDTIDTEDADGWCAAFSPYFSEVFQGPHDEWLIYGPWTPGGDTSLVNPSVSFWERGIHWYDRGNQHEIYVVKGGSTFEIGSLPPPTAVHTPANHIGLNRSWSKSIIQLADSIVSGDTLWLAFRYIGEDDTEDFDEWCIDYVEWNSGNRYNYLPGDANMAVWTPAATWPTRVIGSDVTYLVNYFRQDPNSLPCSLNGFWCSADANGNCEVLQSDVTRLVSYFRGDQIIEWCQDCEPTWPTFDDLPAEVPDGWPYCEEGGIILNTKIIPQESRFR